MIKEIKQNGRIIRVSAQTLDVNAYIIEQKDHLVVIDSLLLPQDSRALSDLALSLHKPVKYLINTHFHSDHCLGNRHVKTKNTIQINQEDYWQTIEREKALINPDKYKPVDKNRLTKADLTFRKNQQIDDLLIIHTPGHSPDSACIYLPEEKALFSGDTVLNNSIGCYSLPYFFWGSCDDLINSQKELLKLDIKTIYSGHGIPLNDKDKLVSDLIYLQKLSKLFLELNIRSDDLQKIVELIPAKKCLTSDQRIAVKRVHDLNIKKLIETNTGNTAFY